MTKLLRSWGLFALSMLLLASLMALVLVFLKLPLLPQAWPLQSWFARALVLHVDLSLLVWALSMVALMWLRHLPLASAWLDRLATVLLFGSGLGVFVSIFLNQGQALLSNYIPVLDAPLYLASLAVFVLAVTLVALPRVSGFSFSAGVPLSEVAFRLSLWALLVTVTVQLIGWWRLAPLALDLQRAELLFWGAGHSLQAVYLCALLGGWFYLLQRSGASCLPLLASAGHRVAVLLMLIVIAVPLLISLAWAPDDPRYREAFSIWMRVFSVPVLGVVWVLLQQFFRQRARTVLGWRVLAVGLSILLFLLGVMLGAMIRGDNLLVPAHYHATTGAVNLIFMALIYDLFCTLRSERWVRWQLQTYAFGVVLMVIGLALSGWMGVGRKLAGSAQASEFTAEMAAMMLMGGGGAIGLGAIFWFVARTLWSQQGAAKPCLYASAQGLAQGSAVNEVRG
ncbi:MAG: cbb3-type cytochrome c oxidase subunit I [Motiliproteus sp.]